MARGGDPVLLEEFVCGLWFFACWYRMRVKGEIVLKCNSVAKCIIGKTPSRVWLRAA